MASIQESIARLDLGLFSHIRSETTEHDKRSLLALQVAMKRRLGRPYRYLEVGSFLGGSLQPHVVDPDCAGIISIDPRPAFSPDERSPQFVYAENTTQHMLDLLGRIPGSDVGKVRTFESDASQVSPEQMAPPADYCFIDGAHIDAAVLSDARSCLKAVNPEGCLAFHDANIIYNGLNLFLDELRQARRPFRAFVLPDTVFVVDLGLADLTDLEPVRTLARDQYQAYLFGLSSNDKYRAVLNRPLFRWLRSRRFIRRLFLLPGRPDQVV